MARQKTIAQALPKSMVMFLTRWCNNYQDHCTPAHLEMLTWEANSGVGYDCVRLGRMASALARKLDFPEQKDAVWRAAARQCLIYAYS